MDWAMTGGVGTNNKARTYMHREVIGSIAAHSRTRIRQKDIPGYGSVTKSGRSVGCLARNLRRKRAGRYNE